MTVTVFLPCRAGSVRVPKKNTRPFGNQPDGLLGVKLRQLLKCKKVEKIVLSTNDNVVMDLAKPYVISSEGKIEIVARPDNLSSSDTLLEDLIKYVPTVVKEGNVVVWTHVTSPFFESEDYDNALEVYFNALNHKYDSLMGVNVVRSFLWDQYGPINYDRSVNKWPSTQSLRPMYEINSAIFICNVSIMTSRSDRIGESPYFYEVKKSKAYDVDWEEDFAAAAELWAFRNHLGPRYAIFGSE